MGPDEQPFFRKVIAPWYDSDVVCTVQIIFMALVFLFGCAGVMAANEMSAYRGILWVPSLLVFLSLTVMVTTTLRLIQRRGPG